MRFKFCGDLDTPDWVLSKILLISKLNTGDLKLISNEVLSEILEGQNRFHKISNHLEEYKFKEVDCKGIIAALRFIFKSSAKYTCDHDALSRELQQLGLHKDGAQILSRIYQLKLKDLRRTLEQHSFRVNKLSNVSWTIKRTSVTMQSDIPLIELSLQLDENEKSDQKSVVLTVDKLLVLSEELKRIKKTIQRINSEL